MIILYTLLTITLLLMIWELIMLFLVRNPKVLQKLWRGAKNSIGYLYVHGERKNMVYREDASQYDPELGYTLKPGKFIYTEREFSNSYFVNSLGVRDTEDALVAPDIVIVGDSLALGWGVDQEKTFAKLLENKIRLKILNTSLPDYGTVRQMLILRKVDRSRLQCLVIQCSNNIYNENLKFCLNDNRLQIMREATYHQLAQINNLPKKYYFGKFVFMRIKKKLDGLQSKPVAAEKKINISEEDLFLNVLKHHEDILASVPVIIVLLLNEKHKSDYFVNSLKQKIADASNPPFIRRMIVLNAMQHITENDFYLMDNHLNDHAHVILADLLEQTFREQKII